MPLCVESHFVRTLLTLCLGLIGRNALADDVALNAESVAGFVERCRKPSGAFGPLDQEYTDAAWNAPAVRTLQLLGKAVAQPEAILAHGLGTPAGHAGLGHYHFYRQHAIRHALGKPVQPRHRKVAVVYQGDKVQYYNSPFGTANDLLYKKPGGPGVDALDLDSETFFYHSLASLHDLLAGLECSRREPADPAPLIEYILKRQAANGGFVETALAPADELATAAQTRHALDSLRILAALDRPSVARAAEFLHSCRSEHGGYSAKPTERPPANKTDVHDTWAALTSLRLLGQAPRDPDATRNWLNSLHNSDGGFGDRPGWRSRLDSSFHAVEALNALGGKAGVNITAKRVTAPAAREITASALRIYQAQFKMPIVTPDELDGLHRRGFNLLALKSDRFELAEALQKAIRERSLPMDAILCPEAYPHRLTRAGGAVLDHVGNFTLDPRWDEATRAKWREADRIGAEKKPWPEYRDQVIGPLVKLGSVAYPEQDFDLEHAYDAYGDDRTGRLGYNAVLVGFNWPPYDFVRVFPWRERYVDRLTPVADVDAHGDLAKWTTQLDHTRTLFIASGPTYADFQAAAAAGRVVTVIAKAEGVPGGATYYGPADAVKYVRDRSEQWRWWK